MIVKTRPQISEVFPDWLTGDGIFSALYTQFQLPWEDVIPAADLDLEYFGNHSGDKFVSPLVSKLLDSDGELSAANKIKLAKAIYSMNSINWTKLWEAVNEEYDPLQNYIGDETERTLSQGAGRVVTDHTGTDSNLRHVSGSTLKIGGISVTNSGTDELKKTGTEGIVTTRGKTLTIEGQEKEALSGIETLAKGGFDNTISSGDKSIEYKGKETSVLSGSEELSKSGSITVKHDGKDYEGAENNNAPTITTKTDNTNDDNNREIIKQLGIEEDKTTGNGDSTVNKYAGFNSIGTNMPNVSGSDSSYNHQKSFGSGDNVRKEQRDIRKNIKEEHTGRTEKEYGGKEITSYGKNDQASDDYSEVTTFNDKTEAKSFGTGEDARKDVENHSDGSTVTYNTTETKTFSGRTNTKSYTGRQDKETNSGGDTTTYNTKDEQKYGKVEITNYNNLQDSNSEQSIDTHTLNLNDTENSSNSSEVQRTFHREGNLGVMTSQQMLTQEFDMRLKYRFFDVVFADVDKTLALQIY